MNEYEKINIIFSSKSKTGFDDEYEIETDSKICEFETDSKIWEITDNDPTE